LSNQGIPSAAYLRLDLPDPTPDMPMNGGYRIMKVEPNRLLLYGSFYLPTILGEPMELTTLLLLTPRPAGGTRLLIRTRGYTYGLFGPLYNLIFELIDFFATSAQLENIRQRAETMVRLRLPVADRIVSERSASPRAAVAR